MPNPPDASPQPSLFAGEEPTVVLPEGYRVVATGAALAALVARLTAVPRFALDTETTDLDPMVGRLVGISFSPAVGEAFYVPVGHSVGRQVPWHRVAEALGTLLGDPARAKIGHNLKFDLRVLERAGLRVSGPHWDTMIAAYLVRAEGGHGLKECARRYLGREMQQFEDLIQQGRLAIQQMEVGAVARYACEDAEATFALREALAPRLAETDQEAVFRLECELVPVVAQMETDGVAVDVATLEELARALEEQLVAKAEACFAAAGQRFNLNSPRQIGAILYGSLGLPASRMTATGPSTDEMALRELAGQHALPGRILEYRELNKLLTTYALALPRAVSPITGRIHPGFHQIGARSGRFSCAHPNLQNLPKDSANTIRRAFVAAPGHVLLSADYSQIELRILAHVSQDPALLAAFQAGEDVHARTAADIFGVPLAAVTPEQRRVAKGINFGLVYGMSPQGLAAQLSIPVPEAERYASAYFARYAGVKTAMADILRRARAQGFVTTITGRRREVSGLKAPDGRARGQAERQAINAPIQGSAADVIKAAMVRLAPRLPEFGARMILQVHDELVIEVPEERAAALREVVVSIMEESPAPGFRVPLRVDTQIARAWS
ncbi:MAG: hypothetical protein HY321_15280 [Armatimonadetes bacterium]|nr:hypothetical protein [Armatimonadota bacterium]